MTRQEQLDRQWHDTGYEDMGIGFKHEPTDPRTDGIPYDLSKPIAPSDDMGGLVDHEWIRKTRAGIPIVHDDPDCAAHRCSAYNSLRGKEIEGCYCSCHLPIAPDAALGTARGIIREMEEPQPQDVLTCEDYDPDQYEPPHTVRGCLIGCILGLIMWALVIWGLYEWLKP